VSFNYYCSHDKEHRLTPCIHELCRKLDYRKQSRWTLGKLVIQRVHTEDDGA